MESDRSERFLLGRSATRRAVLGGSAAAAAVVAAYVAFGNELFGSSATPAPTAAALTVEPARFDDESVRISHLLRRAGFGVTSAEREHYQAIGLDATVSELVDYTSVNDDAAVRLAGQVDLESGAIGAPVVWWLTRIANTRRPLQEKMTLFWHSLLTSQISVVRDPRAMVAQNEFFRANVFAAFPDILKGISKDPAMMVYLDIAGSDKDAPNENYARELMELFALGVGNYSEEDVREAARAFTGWRLPRDRQAQQPRLLDPVFAPARFDAGSKTFLGETGSFGSEDIVDIIVKQDASASFIVGRLFGFFVHADPTAADLAPFIAVYLDNDRRIGPVVEAILRSDVFYSPAAYRAIVKSPVEYAIGVLKALDVQAALGQLLAAGGRRRGGGVLGDMGQVLMEPPNVAGWPGGAAWLNSATLFARLNLIDTLTGGGASDRRGGGLPAVRLAAGMTAGEALDRYLPLVLDDNVPDAARAAVLTYVGGADTPLTPETLRDLVYLILASPQFHLA